MSQSGQATTPSMSVVNTALEMWAVWEAGSAGEKSSLTRAMLECGMLAEVQGGEGCVWKLNFCAGSWVATQGGPS